MDTEAAFNDATGIVVFTIILSFASLGRVSLVSARSNFALIFAGGALVGLIVAFLAELLSSVITEKLTDTILTISAVYGSYALASSLGRLRTHRGCGSGIVLWEFHDPNNHGANALGKPSPCSGNLLLS